MPSGSLSETLSKFSSRMHANDEIRTAEEASFRYRSAASSFVIPGKHIPLSADGKEHFWFLNVVVQLLAKIGDVHVDRPGFHAFGVQAPDAQQNFIPGDG